MIGAAWLIMKSKKYKWLGAVPQQGQPHRLKSELPHHLGNSPTPNVPPLVEAGLGYKAFILIRRTGMISWLQRELG